jgi:Mn-dependent DtxR family transcriptional regulator
MDTSLNVTSAAVQKALDALRTKEVVWRASRGEYALEDQGMSDWLVTREIVQRG